MNQNKKNISVTKRSTAIITLLVSALLFMSTLYALERLKNEDLSRQLRNSAAAVDSLNGDADYAVTTKVDLSTGVVSPQTIKVNRGSTVTWRNGDYATYIVRSLAGSGIEFTSKPLEAGDEFTFAFDEPGTYRYYVEQRPTQMTGTVIVE